MTASEILALDTKIRNENIEQESRPLQQNSIWQNIEDRWDRGLTRVGDITGIQGIKPDTVKFGGKTYATKNKIFNDLSGEELDEKLTNLTAKTQDEADGKLYKLINPSTGEVKYGKAGDGVWNRYSNDPLFQANWDVIYERPMKDVDTAEALIHGNKGARESRSLDYGQAKNALLNAGGTEIYKKDPVIKHVSQAINKLRPVQKSMLDDILETVAKAPEGALISSGYKAQEHVGEDSKYYSKDGTTRVDRMVKSAKDTASDFLRVGLPIAVDKTMGGASAMIAGATELLGGDSTYTRQAQDYWKDRAKLNQAQAVNKEGLAQTMGELALDFAVPAVGPIAKTISTAKKIAQGTIQGFVINAGYEQLKEASGIKEGEEAMPLTAGGIGAVIGMVIGGSQGKAIAKAFDEGTIEQQKKIFESLPEETQKAVSMEVKKKDLSEPEKKTDIAIEDKTKNKAEDAFPDEQVSKPTVEPKQQTASETLRKLPKKPSEIKKEELEKSPYTAINPMTGEYEKVLKPEPVATLKKQDKLKPKKEVVKTKKGKVITSPEVIEGKKKLESLEWEVVSPKDKEGLPLKENEYVPEVNNPKQFKYGYDEVGRVYVEEGSQLSHQGGLAQKASLKQKAPRKVTNTDEEVARRLEFYDRDESLRETYGQTQASYKENKELSKSEKLANRLQFEKEQYKDIIKNSELTKEDRAKAREKLSELNKKKITDYTTDKTAKTMAQAELDKQTKIELDDTGKREEDIREEYEEWSKGNKPNPTKSEGRTYSNIKKKLAKLESEAKKEIREVRKKEKMLGKDFDEKNITDAQKQAYRDEIANIQDYQYMKSDLLAYEKKLLDIEELRYRESRRIDDKLYRDKESSFEEGYERGTRVENYQNKILKEYDDIGFKKLKSDIEFNDWTPSGKPESQEWKAEREAKELKQSTTKHEQIVANLEKAKELGDNPRRTGTKRRGQRLLSDSQFKDVQDDILTLEEIANKTSPIGLKSDIKELKTKAKEFANRKVTEHHRKNLGIIGRLKRAGVQLKDTLLDASNSVAQITTALLSSKTLARITKSGGKMNAKDEFGKAIDIRDIIGLKMEEHGFKKPDITIDGKKASWKDLVKPIFMKENYGQGRKGLINGIAEHQGISKADAEIFLKEYEKAFESLAPEMKKLKEEMIKAYKKSGGTIKYTLPDDFEVEFQIKKEVDGSYKISGNTMDFTVKIDDINEASMAILPRIIHSVDAYVAKQMNAKGIATVHDAFQTPAEWVAKYGQKKADEMTAKAYGEIMAKVNDADIMDQILYSISGKITDKLAKEKTMSGELSMLDSDIYDATTKSVKEGTLSSEDIKYSAEHMESIVPEEIAGKVEKAKLRKMDVSSPKTEDDAMLEFMATGDVRESNYKQIVSDMVNESGLRTMSVAKNDDNVFERQIALAHQSSVYNDKLAIEAPKGVNEEVWNRVQKNIFIEARAKLELNPLLRKVIQGERKYFDKNGKMIGDTTETYQQLLVKAKRIQRKITKAQRTKDIQELKRIEAYTKEIEAGIEKLEKLPEKKKTQVMKVGTKYETLSKKVKGWKENKIRTTEETEAELLVNDTAYGEPDATVWEQFKRFIKTQTSNDEVSKAFNKLFYNRKVSDANVAQKAEAVQTKLDSIVKEKDRKLFTEHLVHRDATISRKYTEEQGKEFLENTKHIYEQAKPAIDKAVKAWGREEYQTGSFLNNSRLIAEHYNMTQDMAPIIDDIISLKTMNGLSWQFVENFKGKDLDYIFDMIQNNRARGKKLLGSNYVNGYAKEVNDTGYNLQGLDVESKFEMGAIPSTKENSKVGYFDTDAKDEVRVWLMEKYGDENPPSGFQSRQEMLRFAEEKDYKVTSKGFRKVVDGEARDKAGRSNDFTRIMTETYRATELKEQQRILVKGIAEELLKGGNAVISTHPKENFVKLTKEQIASRPYMLKENLKYVHKDLVEPLLGRDEVRAYNGEVQAFKIADRVWANLNTRFKKNVVLFNPSSHKNALIVNQTLGLNVGISPNKLKNFQIEAVKQSKENAKILQRIAEAEAVGKPTKRLYKLLEKSDLYKMEKMGLSTNKVEGMLGSNDAIASFLSKMTNGKFDTIAREITFGDNSYVAKKSAQLFSMIDTGGRYGVAKGLMEKVNKKTGKNYTMQEAVDIANGLFADMDRMVPAFIEKADKYGIPFSKWFSLSSPVLLRMTKGNMGKSIALGIVLYELSIMTDLNLSSVNPIEAMIDFTEQSTIGQVEDVIKTPLNKLSSYLIPNIYKDIYKEYREGDKGYSRDHRFLLKKRSKDLTDFKPVGRDLRGVSQQMVESFTGKQKKKI